MSEVRWIPTTAEAYRAVYAAHHDGFVVFATHTCMDGCHWHSEPNLMTQWGFKDADYPLLKSEMRGERHTPNERWSYWIAQPIAEVD